MIRFLICLAGTGVLFLLAAAAGELQAATALLHVLAVVLPVLLTVVVVFGVRQEAVANRRRVAAYEAAEQSSPQDQAEAAEVEAAEVEAAEVEARIAAEWRTTQRRVLGIWVTESWVSVDPSGQLRLVSGIQSLTRASGARRMGEIVREEILRDGGELARAESTDVARAPRLEVAS